MFPAPSRRDVLQILLGGAAGFALPSRVFGQRPAIDPARGTVISTRLADHVTEYTGAGGNVVVVAGTDGLVMIDGGLRARSADLLSLVAAQHAGLRVRALFNTDWHPERTGSNETQGAAGAKIIAHENTKQYLGAEIYVDWQQRTYPPLAPQARPTDTFYTSGTMTAGAERIQYGHLGQAHTDAAIYVFLPAANVLVAGGALSAATYPIPDYTTGGWLGGLIAANKTLLGVANAETRIVPGAGPLQSRADLQAQHDMLAAMLERFVKMMKQGLGPDDIIAAAPTREFDGRWGNPELFVATSYRSMWLHVRELGGIV